MVMQQIANLSSGNRCIGSSPILSAIKQIPGFSGDLFYYEVVGLEPMSHRFEP